MTVGSDVSRNAVGRNSESLMTTGAGTAASLSRGTGRPRETGGPRVTSGAGSATARTLGWLPGATEGRQDSSPARTPVARRLNDRATLAFHNLRMASSSQGHGAGVRPGRRVL